MRTTLFSFLAAAALATAFILSCKKDTHEIADISTHTTFTIEPSQTGEEVGFRSTTDPDEQTVILGQPQAIPYAVSIVTQAWNQMTGQSLSTIAPTHLYVRFLPQDVDELKTLYDLEESDDLDFDMYPLHYEILQEGVFYHDPSVGTGEITWRYTTVPVGFSFPAIHYEVLAQLVNLPYMTHLTKKAYEIAGVPYDDSWIAETPIDDPNFCEPDCLNWPCCYQFNVNCDVPIVDCDCYPGDPSWPDCLEPNGGGEPPAANLNECGCPIPFNKRYPAGCIQVADTQINPEPGVRRVKVKVKNNPFFGRTTSTEDSGCWKINKEHAGKVRVKVKFENDKCKIRAIRNWAETLWQATSILTDENLYYGPSYNNIHILYVQNSNVNSIGRALWYGATGNNALWEFHSYAAADGIDTPPGGLDILLTPASNGEAAPMLGKISSSIWGIIAISAFVTVIIAGVPFVGLPIGLLATYISAYAPDVVYNHGGVDVGEASDAAKETWYHEFAHASHFQGLNNDSYWRDNIKYIVDNNGYGNGTANGAGRCAVIESWGYHYGPVCADRQYGLLHSNGGSTPQTIERFRHIFLLEGFTPLAAPNTLDAWIPKGVYLDCIDNNAVNPPGVADGVGVEPITGFTHSNCFNAISGSPANPTVVRNVLTSTFLPPGQTVAGVNALFAIYGF